MKMYIWVESESPSHHYWSGSTLSRSGNIQYVCSWTIMECQKPSTQ